MATTIRAGNNAELCVTESMKSHKLRNCVCLISYLRISLELVLRLHLSGSVDCLSTHLPVHRLSAVFGNSNWDS